MSRPESFDDFNSSEYAQEAVEQKPFQFRDHQNSREETLNWLNTNFEMLEKQAQSRIYSYIKWSYLFKGVHWRNLGSVSNRAEYDHHTSKKPKMVDNMIWEYIDHKVSQMSRLGVDITCIPWNDEQSDVNNAKACDMLLKARALDMDMDSLQDEADRGKFKYGTMFQIPVWDEDAGPMSPALERLNEIYPDGLPKRIQKRIKQSNTFRVGDADLINAYPWEVYPEAYKQDWKKVDSFDYSTWMDIEEVKARWSKHASKIKENERTYRDFAEDVISIPKHMVNVRYFYHRKTKFLPGGALIIYTDDVILEWRDLPYDHGKLPLIVDRDIEIEKELFGRPKISNIEQYQRQSNNILSSVARDLGAGSAPKWVWPKGAVDFKSANNDFSVMEYKGPKEPKLVANNPVSQQALSILDRNEGRIAKLMKVYDISRGVVPPGIEANAALRFLDEQEDQANEEDKKKRRKRVVKGYQFMASLMSQNYDESDNRTARILGKKDYMIKNLKSADFTRVYDVQIQNTSGLPDTKSGKIAAMIDINMATQADPVFRNKEFVKYLDLGMDDQYIDRITASENAASETFEMIMTGESVPEPELFDDLPIYYEVFWKNIQGYKFKTKTDPSIKGAVYAYIKTLEGLIFVKAQTNPKLAQDMMQVDYYPSFFKIPQINPAVPNASQPQQPEAGVDASKLENIQDNIEQNNKE